MRNIFRKIIHRKKVAWPVFLFIFFLLTGSIIVYASFGGGQTSSTPNLQRGLIAYWTMDESDYHSGSQVLADKTPYSNYAKNYGAIFDNNRLGSSNSSMQFNVNKENLLMNYRTWKDGQSGSVGGFGTYGAGNARVIAKDPWNRDVVVWRSGQSPVVNNGGIYHSAQAIDNTKLYRMSWWEKRVTNASATYARYYAGLNGYGSVNGVVNLSSGTYTTNPYFWNSSNVPTSAQLPVGEWVLVVGHIFPYTHSGTVRHADSGRYTLDGFLGHNNVDYKWAPETTTARSRTLAVYQADDENVVHYTVYPRLDVVDGTEPSIADLLGGHDSYGDDVVLEVAENIVSISFWYKKENEDDWYHVVNSAGSIYTNGSLVNPGDYPIVVSGNTVYLGRTTLSDFFNGQIDDVLIYNRALSANEIKLLYDSQQAKLSGRSADGGLVGYWSMDQDDYNSSTQKLSDKTPQTKHGTNYGATFVNDRFGQAGKAMSFNGSGNYIDIGNHSVYDLVDAGSVSVWVKIPSVWTGSQYPNLVSKGASAGWDTNGWSLFIFGSGTTGVGMRNGSTINVRSFTNTIKDQWTHIVGTWDGATISVYQDGILKTSMAQTIKPAVNSTNVVIGRLPNTHYFSGELDEVRIYDKALTLAEVKSLYESHRPQIMSNLQKGLVLDMPLKSNYMKSATILTDRTPYSYDGTNYAATITDDGATFNGSSNYIKIPKIEPFNLQELTISTWVNFADNSTSFIFEKGNVNTQYSLFSHGTDLVFRTKPVGAAYDTLSLTKAAAGITNGSWHYITATFDGSVKKLYVDNNLVASRNWPYTIEINNNDCSIGRFGGTSSGYYFTGQISNVRVYNRALGDEEISLLYSRGR